MAEELTHRGCGRCGTRNHWHRIDCQGERQVSRAERVDGGEGDRARPCCGGRARDHAGEQVKAQAPRQIGGSKACRRVGRNDRVAEGLPQRGRGRGGTGDHRDRDWVDCQGEGQAPCAERVDSGERDRASSGCCGPARDYAGG